MTGDPPYGCGHMWHSGPYIALQESPRVLPVNLPFSKYGITTAAMDGDGNVTIKVDQPSPPSPITEEERHAIGHATLMVKASTPEKSEVCFDYELVQDLLNVIDRFAERH